MITATNKKQVNLVYLTMYNYVKANLKLPNLELSKQARNKYVNVLKRANLIKKVGYGTWEITDNYTDEAINKAKQVNLKTTLGTTQQLGGIYKDLNKFTCLRSHAFQFKVKIPKIENWNKRTEYLTREHILFKESKIKALGQQLIIKGHKIWLTDKSLVIYGNKDYIVSKAIDGKNYAISDMLEIIASVETLLKTSFKINKRYIFKVTNQHHAKLKDTLANQYRRDGKKLYVNDARGLWLWIDYSKGIDELETGNRPNSDIDMDNGIVPFFNSIKQNRGFTLNEIKNIVGQVAENQAVFGENLISHVGAVKQLGEAVSILSNKIGRYESHVRPLDYLKANIHNPKDLVNYQGEIIKLNDEEKQELSLFLFSLNQ